MRKLLPTVVMLLARSTSHRASWGKVCISNLCLQILKTLSEHPHVTVPSRCYPEFSASHPIELFLARLRRLRDGDGDQGWENYQLLVGNFMEALIKVLPATDRARVETTPDHTISHTYRKLTHTGNPPTHKTRHTPFIDKHLNIYACILKTDTSTFICTRTYL